MKELTVDSDTNEIAEFLEFATCQLEWSEIPEDKVVVCARGLEFVTTANQLLAEGLRVRDDLLGVCLPCWLASLEKRSGDTSDGL